MPRQQRIVTDLSENSRHTFGLRMQARALLVTLAGLLTGPAGAQTDSTMRPVRTFQPYKGSVERVKEDTPVTAMDSAAPVLRQPGEVILEEDPRITGFMKDYAERPDELKGYRVQIFLGDRAEAQEARSAFLRKHPDTPAYLSYLAPNFRVRVGDLRDRREAERLRSTLRADHPGCYIVPDRIEPPALPEEGSGTP